MGMGSPGVGRVQLWAGVVGVELALGGLVPLEPFLWRAGGKGVPVPFAQ